MAFAKTSRREASFWSRLRLAVLVGVKRSSRRLKDIGKFVVSEQRSYRPGRTRTAFRIAAIVASYAALMAIFHVQSGTAQYALWLMVAPPGPMWKSSQALFLTFTAALLMGLSVPLAGFLAQVPGLELLFIGVFSAVSVYVVNALRLGARGFVMQLIFLEAFYGMATLGPAQAQFQAANTFAGYLIAFFVIALFDVFLWPNPAGPILLESLSVSLRGESRRLLKFVDPGAPQDQSPLRPLSMVESDISVHLGLLDRARQEGMDARKEAISLGAIAHGERIFVQIEHVVREFIPIREGQIPEALRLKLGAIIEAASRAIEESASNILLFAAGEPSRLAQSVALRDELKNFQSRISNLEHDYALETRNVPELGVLVHSLRELDLALSHPFEESLEIQNLQESSWTSLFRTPLDSDLIRFSLKTAAAVVICFVIGFISHDPRLWVAPVTVFTVAFQSYGTAIRRMFLRLIGSIIGGVIIISLMSLVTPNLSTLPAYMLTTLSVVFIAAYAGLSSEKIAYAGRQIGDVFIILFMGLGQPTNLYDPFWRILGIGVGIIVPMIIYRSVWPQTAADRAPALISRFIDSILGMRAQDPIAIQSASNQNTRLLAESLNLADDAKLEGARSGVHPEAVIDASDALWQTSHRLAAIYLRKPDAEMWPEVAEFSRLQEEELELARRRLECWRGIFTREIGLEALDAESLEDPLRVLEEKKLLAFEALSERDQLALRGEVEVFKHLRLLLKKLDAALTAVPLRRRNQGDWREILKWNARTA